MLAVGHGLELQRGFTLFWLGLVAWALLGGGGGCSPAVPPDPHEPAGFQSFTSPQGNPIVLSPDRAWVYIANTTSNSVAFLRTSNFMIPYTVTTGLEPVSLAVRPDGLELWVSNHLSDSVSVIDTDPTSASYAQVIETIQLLDANGVAELDEPVGIAFASNSKAYVALSSRNRIAVVDAASYAVTGFIEITAQEPRAIAVRNGNLYVAAFESGNQSQLSACVTPDANPDPSDVCTLGLPELIAFATNPNLPGEVKNIVTLPSEIPDRDVFVYSTANEALLSTAHSVGTLLYGLAVAADGTIYVSETDARNLVNGGHDQLLADLDGRMFDNEIARVTCSGASCTSVATNLEPGVPTVTTHANSLATPYGIALSGNDATLLVTAAGASRLASFDTATMAQLGVLDVGSIPKGVAFDAPGSSSGTAYVLNTLGNSVSKVSVAANGALALVATKTVGIDPTPLAVRNGNIAFNSAFASTTGSHSCGSCHPDSNTDQLIWRIGGNCAGIGCGDGDEPRTTMPVRGLKNTLPLHWDGTLGDPFGGGNGEVGLAGIGGTDCTLGDADGDHDCFLNLVQGSLSGVMCDQAGACPNTGLTVQQQDDMATFLASVSYPPARSRRIDDTLSDDSDTADLNGIPTSARQGFADFFTDVGGAGGTLRTCADANGGCHALPLGTATNSTTLNGFDVPTMRGLTDRFLQFSMGPTAAVDIQAEANVGISGASPLEAGIAWDPNLGFQEVTTFGTAFGIFQLVYGMRPPNLFQMFEEASTGYSGAVGRQLTLNTSTAPLPATLALLTSLQNADARGVVNLRGRALRSGAAITLSYDATAGNYIVGTGGVTLSQAALLAEAQAGTTLATLTAQLRSGATNGLQPLLATSGAIANHQVGDPPLPQLTTLHPPFNVTGTDVSSTAIVFVDGAPVGATLTCSGGITGGFCNNGIVSIDLAARPVPEGLHLLQVQNPAGLLSNELPICIATVANRVLCIND